MKKQRLFSVCLILCAVLVACSLLLAGCDEEEGEHTHAFGEWEVTKAPTCAEKGEETRTCECSESETREVAATGKHNYTNWIITTEPSCVDKGIETGTCGCGATDTREVGEPTGKHIYGTDNKCTGCSDNWGSTEGLQFIPNPDGESYYVSGHFYKTVTSIIIPYYYNGKPVTAIGDYAFSNSQMLQSVKIPDTVTSIGQGAFAGCNALKTVGAVGSDSSLELPDSVTTIGNFAFQGCSGLQKVILPDSITSLGAGSFSTCGSLTKLVLSKNITVISGNIVGNSRYITSVGLIGSGCAMEIGEGVTTLAPYAFMDCYATSITLPSGVSEIGEGVFANCTRLEDIVIPSGVTAIGTDAFWNCTALEKIYYSGANWSDISISASGNDALAAAKVYIYSATQPTTMNTHWHYVDGAPTVWGVAPDHVHSFENWQVTTEPTCADKGIETGTCGCGATDTRDVAATGDHS